MTSSRIPGTLQKLMLGSWSNTLVSVRQVTQRNAGRQTAGIDGEVPRRRGESEHGGAGARFAVVVGALTG